MKPSRHSYRTMACHLVVKLRSSNRALSYLGGISHTNAETKTTAGRVRRVQKASGREIPANNFRFYHAAWSIHIEYYGKRLTAPLFEDVSSLCEDDSGN